jgi:hypothetical protein
MIEWQLKNQIVLFHFETTRWVESIARGGGVLVIDDEKASPSHL